MRLSLSFIVNMYICICKGIRESQLKNLIIEFNSKNMEINLENIQKYSGAGTRCGCCIESIQEIIEEYTTSQKEKFYVHTRKEMPLYKF